MNMTSCGCGDQTAGIFDSNWVWVLIAIICCCSRDGGFGNVLGTSMFRGNPPWILILILLYCCCFRDNRRC